jgi:hypothetical protein
MKQVPHLGPVNVRQETVLHMKKQDQPCACYVGVWDGVRVEPDAFVLNLKTS